MLINCKECGREVSDTAKACPHCGAKVKKEKVDKEKTQRNNPLKGLVECATSTTKGKWIYLGTVFGCCAIALCFLILTILSFAAPYAFLHSEPCNDGYALIDKMALKSQNQYQITISGDKYTITRFKIDNRIVVSVGNISGPSDSVQYHFANDGSLHAWVFIGAYQFDYEYEDTIPVFVAAYKNYKFTSLSTTERKLGDAAIKLSEAVFDVVLITNGKSYDFNDILSDYGDYRDSLIGIKVSSTVLAVLFMALSVCGIVFYDIYTKKVTQTDEPLKEEANETPQE